MAEFTVAQFKDVSGGLQEGQFGMGGDVRETVAGADGPIPSAGIRR